MEHYGKSQRQYRILKYVRAIASQKGAKDFLGAIGSPIWRHPEKRYAVYDKGADKILEKFLTGRGVKYYLLDFVAKRYTNGEVQLRL